MTTLLHVEARRVYDRIGRKQDTQAFYEDRATSLVISHLHLATAQAVFEFGCGTGEDIAQVINEAHRILRPNGLLGLSGLTTGFTVTSRAFAWLLAQIHAIRPSLVGGCRSLELLSLLPQHQWKIRHHARLAPLCIPVEAVVAVRT
jgi:hypothetical protein